MAVFKAPKISQPQRQSLVLDISEIVFDTTENRFYGGDGATPGGFQIGAGFNVEKITLTQSNLDNKKVVLSSTPLYPEAVTLVPVGGIPQENGIDFEVIGNEISWNGLGLDNFLELNEKLIIQY